MIFLTCYKKLLCANLLNLKNYLSFKIFYSLTLLDLIFVYLMKGLDLMKINN
jgi:hypothetical protein